MVIIDSLISLNYSQFFHLRCNRMSNKDEMMHASVADVKWNAPAKVSFYLCLCSINNKDRITP